MDTQTHADDRSGAGPAGGVGEEQRTADGHVHGMGASPECQLCPICVVLQAVGSARPDVVQHLLAAARELALAMKTVADGHAEAADRAQAAMSDRLTRITID